MMCKIKLIGELLNTLKKGLKIKNKNTDNFNELYICNYGSKQKAN